MKTASLLGISAAQLKKMLVDNKQNVINKTQDAQDFRTTEKLQFMSTQNVGQVSTQNLAHELPVQHG